MRIKLYKLKHNDDAPHRFYLFHRENRHCSAAQPSFDFKIVPKIPVSF